MKSSWPGALLLLAALSGPASAATLHPFACAPVEGLRADSLARHDFLDAFNQVLNQAEVALEARGSGGWSVTRPLDNRFRRSEGEADPGAWLLRVVVQLPAVASYTRQESMYDGKRWVRQSIKGADPRRRQSRRFGVTVAVWSPGELQNEVESEPVVTSVVFPGPAAPEGGMLVPPPQGYAFPWAEAGRAAGLLALEALHRHSGELPGETRCVIEPALRADFGAETSAR